ncbi:MAG: hydrogenase subunit MbhD domain-containing protein [Bacillota bacterium]
MGQLLLPGRRSHMISIFQLILILTLIVVLVSVARMRDLLSAVILFAVYNLIMSLLWQQLRAPDVAITEAALGAGVTTVLLVAAISKTGRLEK